MKKPILLLVMLIPFVLQAQPGLKTDNLILITLDGLRWQELFDGADSALIRDNAFVEEPEALVEQLWRSDRESRRAVLMPFCWRIIATQGQIYGNRWRGSNVEVTNRYRFSYPGYNEILTGWADERVTSNDKIDNPNVTVLEFINEQAGFRRRVAAFGSWEVFPFIINESRSGIPVNAGFREAGGEELTWREEFLNELQRQIPSPWRTVRLDAFTHHYAMEYARKHHPRLIYIAYGETDDFAHDRRYDAYLHAAQRADGFINDWWRWAQSDPRYRDKTTIIITTDHGRGDGRLWYDHGEKIVGADHIWLAAIGPDTPPLGEITVPSQLYQNQIAKTVATLLGVEYHSQQPVGEVIRAVIGDDPQFGDHN